MLHLAYLGESKKMDFKEDALRLLAVRKPVSGIPMGFIHAPQLSPSLKLFDYNRANWKQGIFQGDDIAYLHSLNQSETDPEAWWFLYEREFKKELIERPDMVRAIERIEKLLVQGKEIYVFCYCKDVCRCHRGAFGEHMKAKGYEVDFRKKVEKPSHEQSPSNQLSLFDL